MTQKIIMDDETIVKKSNALARARHSSDSIWIGRLVAIIASQVRKEDTDFKMYDIPVQEILTATGTSRTGQIYDALQEIAMSVMSRVIKIEDEDKNGWSAYSLFSKCSYKKGGGYIQARFDPDLKPHFLDLQGLFTLYPLKEYLSLPSSYSQRIFEFLHSWNDKPQKEVSIEDLHKMLDTPPSLRKNFYDFNRRVLDKAYKDIKKHTKLRYEYDLVRKGRKVVKIRFSFGTKSKAKAKNKQIDNKKQSTKNNALFLAAVQCAADHPNGCGQLRGTKDCCKVCMEPKKAVETELDLFE